MWDPDPEREWPIWQIDDVRLAEDGKSFEVSMLWNWRPTPGSAHLRRLEPMDLIAQTNPEDVMLAMRFKESGEQHFLHFCKTDEYGKRMLAASDNYNCAFNALSIAGGIIGRPNLVPQTVVDQFLAEELAASNDLRHRCTWKQFAKLLPRLRDYGCDIVVNNKNYIKGGRRGARVLNELPFEDGLYLVGAYNRYFYGHRMVLRVEAGGSRRTIFDEDKHGNILEGTVKDQKKWINFFSFVRPFCVFWPRW